MLFDEVNFVGSDDTQWFVPLKDIVQYHSIHKRAQIQMLIRAQGLEPDFIDYIKTKYVKK